MVTAALGTRVHREFIVCQVLFYALTISPPNGPRRETLLPFPLSGEEEEAQRG